LVSEFKQLYLQLARDIEFFNYCIKYYYDKIRQKKSDLKKKKKIYFLYRNIKTKQSSSKLDYLKLELFEIEKKTGPVNYRLKLPDSIQYIYPIFYISLFESVPENTKFATNIEIEKKTENEYKIERILNIKYINRRFYYLVK